MTDLANLFDSYSRQARLYPALLTISPVIFLVLGYFPDDVKAGQVLVGIAVSCGLLFFLSDFARTRGKKLESILLREWGGWPTTIWLRHRDTTLSDDVKLRYHGFLAKQPRIGKMPTKDEEMSEPARADIRYAAAVAWLKEQCRGAAFPLVEKENTTYGFRRNLLGLKPIGSGICILILLSPLVVALLHLDPPKQDLAKFLVIAYLNVPGTIYGALAYSLIFLIAWLFIVNRHWVRSAGDQYARALLANCDSL